MLLAITSIFDKYTKMVQKKYVAVVVLVIMTAALLPIRQKADWKSGGENFIASITDEPCIAYTVNSPAYMDKAEKVNCKQYDFKYFPENKKHAKHYGKVFWGIKIAESNYNGTVVYFDWDVMPEKNSARALRNGTILLARDTHNITTNWFSFSRGAEEFLRRWMSHTNSPRDYNIEDQKWIHAELGSTEYETIEARLVIRGHCHNRLVNRKACVKSMYGHGPVYNIPWKLVTASGTFSIVILNIAYSCLPVYIYVLALLLEIVARSAWLYALIEHGYASVNQIVGMGETTRCPSDMQPLWNARNNKPRVPFDRIYVGDSLIETKEENSIVLVSNGKKILKCIKAANRLHSTHNYYLILSLVLPLACILIYKVANCRSSSVNKAYAKFAIIVVTLLRCSRML